MKPFKIFCTEELNATITFVDIDETLFKTTARVGIKDSKTGQPIRMLSNQEFKKYKLQPGEAFDFHEFWDSKLFYDTSKPIKNVITTINKIIQTVYRLEKGNKVILLTARGAQTNLRLFRQTFRDHGLEIDKIHDIIFVSAKDKPESVAILAEKKKKKMITYLDSGRYTEARMYDDTVTNLEKFLSLRGLYPNIKFVAFYVNTKGSIKKWSK